MPTSPRLLVTELRLYFGCTLPLLCKPTPFIQRQALKWLGWLPKQCHAQTALGFTLAEVLIALAILAVIATFTIPKILVAQQSQQYRAIAKETAGMLSATFQQAQMAGSISGSANVGTLTPYMNYLRVDTSSLSDDWNTGTSWGCTATIKCLVLPSGAKLAYDSTDSFVGTANTDFIEIQVDPDGVYSGTTNGPGKAVNFRLYYNGRMTTGGVANNNSSYDPTWFQW